MTKIIAMVNQKGGVGKTTSAINLAAALSIANKRVLLVDLDPQGNATVGLGANLENGGNGTIYHVLVGLKDIREVICQTELPYLDLVPSGIDLVGAEIELINELAREQKLLNALRQTGEKYDYIIIDCPPSLNLLTVNALTAANSVIVPLQTEYFAMEGLAQLLNTIKLINQSINPNLVLEGVLLTMFDSRNNLHKQVADEIQNHFKERVFEMIIPRNVKLSECPSFGKPIVLYDITSKGSQAYMALAKELIFRERSIERSVERVEEERNSISL